MREKINYLLKKINNLCNKRVMVIGDVFLDEYDFGEVKTVSTGIKVPIVEAKISRNSLGGAGNVAANISALTSNASFLTQYANDESGKKIEQLLIQYNISTRCFPANRSIVKKRIYIDHQQVMRLDQNEYTYINHKMIRDEIRKSKCDVIVVADYSFGMVDQFVLDCCKEKSLCDHIPLIFSSRKVEEFDTSDISLIVVNEKDDSNSITYNFNLQNDTNTDIIITRGPLGIKALMNHKIYDVSTIKDLPVNVSGAGDTVLAIVSLLYQSGIDVETYLCLANIAAGIAIRNELTYRLRQEDLISRLFELECMHAKYHKCVDLDSANIIVNTWKKQGKNIVLVDKCLNPLDSEWLMTLEKNKKNNDKIILTIRANESENRLLINKLSNQTILLSFMGLFDLIVILGSEGANDVVEVVKPDIHIQS